MHEEHQEQKSATAAIQRLQARAARMVQTVQLGQRSKITFFDLSSCVLIERSGLLIEPRI